MKSETKPAASSSSDFKLIKDDEKSSENIEKKKVEKTPAMIVEEMFSKDVELPKQLPVYDFNDEPKVSNKKNKKNRDKKSEKLPTRDYVKEAQKMPEPKSARKKQKTKFSKISNPFPNEPSRSVEASKTPKKSSPKKEKAASLEVQSQNTSVFTAESVDSLKIHPHSIKNMKEVLNFHKLTHVQQKSIPPALESKDLLIRSATGSGKTLTYALPIVERLQRIQPKIHRSHGIHALVIVPTRELCIQTYELFVKLVKPFTWIVPGYLSGGEKRKTEKARLRNGITILISTPGRLCDHLMHTESMKFDKVETFVLDEADRLLELGYENDVKKVVDTITEHSKNSNKDIQKILLSATLTAKVKQLAGLTLRNPIYVDNEGSETIKYAMENAEIDENITIPSGIEQKYFMLPARLRFSVLCSLLVQQMTTNNARKILIFFPTQHVVDYHYDILVEFLTQPFTKKAKTAQSYLNDDDEDIDDMLQAQEESDEEDEGNIWLPNVTLFK
jgi:ATP-dependent RNA helicase DDX31/DBP7